MAEQKLNGLDGRLRSGPPLPVLVLEPVYPRQRREQLERSVARRRYSARKGFNGGIGGTQPKVRATGDRTGPLGRHSNMSHWPDAESPGNLATRWTPQPRGLGDLDRLGTMNANGVMEYWSAEGMENWSVSALARPHYLTAPPLRDFHAATLQHSITPTFSRPISP